MGPLRLNALLLRASQTRGTWTSGQESLKGSEDEQSRGYERVRAADPGRDEETDSSAEARVSSRVSVSSPRNVGTSSSC